MKIAIIGGGPAGMMASIMAQKDTNEVVIFEKNEKLGKKLFITGKGRCNVTNACDLSVLKNNIIVNDKFMYSSLSQFDNKQLIKFLEKNDCPIKIERGLRVFSKSDKAYDITDCFKRKIKQKKIKVNLNERVVNVELKNNESSNNIFFITTESNNKINKYTFDKLIIATGGMSYPTTGSNGEGLDFAKKLGVKINNTIPVLTPMVVENDIRKIQNILLKNIGVKLYRYSNEKKIIYEDFGDLEFYRYGITGPVVLKATSYMLKQEDIVFENRTNEKFSFENLNDVPSEYKLNQKIKIVIDLKPSLTVEQLDKRIIREIEKLNKINNIKDLLRKVLPYEMIDYFEDMLNKDGIIVYDNSMIKWTKELRRKIIYYLKNFELTICGIRGFNESIITRGGIDVKQINPKTMEVKNVNGLYFAGEILDVDCLTGGFNITVAMSTGFVAGNNIL